MLSVQENHLNVYTEYDSGRKSKMYLTKPS